MANTNPKIVLENFFIIININIFFVSKKTTSKTYIWKKILVLIK